MARQVEGFSTVRYSKKREVARLRKEVIKSLKAQGFSVGESHLKPSFGLEKEYARRLHETAVEHSRERARPGLARHEAKLLGRFANGNELDPCAIHPQLVEVSPGSEDELLFRYACRHWSIPVSSGYGRRLRFLVVDKSNDKLIGLIGLCDPVFGLQPRDTWIGWSGESRRSRLINVMDAFVIGAVPPYSQLLCGKFVAMLLSSTEVQRAFDRKYRKSTSVISRRHHVARLALVTTASALGRSSIYNRLSFENRKLFEPVGFTSGSGDFQFLNGVYSDLFKFAQRHCLPTAKQEPWGIGFRNRREVVKKCLQELELPPGLLYHGVRRELFVVPLARNSRQFLRGEHSRLFLYKQSAAQLFAFFRQRWLLPRAARDQRFKDWNRESWALWGPTTLNARNSNRAKLNLPATQ